MSSEPPSPGKRLHRKRRSPRYLLLGWIALVVIVGAGVGLGVRILAHKTPLIPTTTTTTVPGSTTSTPPATTTTTVVTSTTNTRPSTTTTSSSSPTTSTSSTSTTSTSTSTTTTSTTIAPELKPSQVVIEVFNGTGASGLATAAATALTNEGFTVNATNNATSYTYVESVVQYSPGSHEAAVTVQKWITGGTKLVQVAGLAANEIYLILGSQYTGLT